MISKSIDAIVQQVFYEHYLKENPELVSGIKTLIISGRKTPAIKKYCERVCGKSMTSVCVSWMIDYVNRQTNN